MKTPESGAYLTKRLESERQSKQKTKTALAKAMGINRRTYERKLASLNGFTDLELCRGLKALGLTVYLCPHNMEAFKVEIQ